MKCENKTDKTHLFIGQKAGYFVIPFTLTLNKGLET